jgi:hypothetical protein
MFLWNKFKNKKLIIICWIRYESNYLKLYMKYNKKLWILKYDLKIIKDWINAKIITKHIYIIFNLIYNYVWKIKKRSKF